MYNYYVSMHISTIVHLPGPTIYMYSTNGTGLWDKQLPAYGTNTYTHNQNTMYLRPMAHITCTLGFVQLTSSLPSDDAITIMNLTDKVDLELKADCCTTGQAFFSGESEVLAQKRKSFYIHIGIALTA